MVGTRSRRIALAALTVPDVDPVEFIRIAADAGFDAVGLSVCASAHMRAPLADDGSLRVAVKKILADTGLDVLEVGVFRLSSTTAIADLVPAIDLGAELGARIATVCGADVDEARMIELFVEFCEAAAQRGMCAALEFVPYLYPRNLPEAQHIVLQARNGAAICVDALHFCRSGSDVADLRCASPGLIAYAQFCDAASATPPASIDGLKREARTDRRYPGEGALPLFDLLDALPSELPLSIESPCLAYAHLPPAARARQAANATLRLLEAYRSKEQ